MNTRSLGSRVRELRFRRGWTLSELASRSSISISTLSKVERDQLSLTYDKLVQLARGLDIDIARLFSDAAADPGERSSARRSVNRADSGEKHDTQHYRHEFLSSDLLRKRFLPIIVEVRVRSLAEFGPLTRHDGEEFSYVLEGEIELHTEYYAPALLKAGDSVYFSSAMAHGYIARGDATARMLTINTAPECDPEDMLHDAPRAPPAPAPLARRVRKSGSRSAE